MKSRLVLLMGLLAAFWATGCVDPQIDITGDGPKIGTVEQGECKGTPLTAAERDSADSAYYMGTIAAKVDGRNVTITHSDVTYQCAAKIAFSLETDGKNLHLVEIDRAAQVADCLCRMDLSVTVSGLADGTYTLDVKNESKDLTFGTVTFTIGGSQPQCASNADCDALGLTHDTCAGAWACVSGQCQWGCSTSCSSSADCPSGFECTFYGTPAEDTDASGAAMPAQVCKMDSECASGQVCILPKCADATTKCIDGTGYCMNEEPGVCTPIQGCTAEWAPVCGTDNHTYGNACEAARAHVGIAYEGECELTECRSAADCQELTPMVDCIGSWDCVNGACLFSCGQTGCQSNGDCPSGYHCEFPVYGGETPTAPAYSCQADSDCPVGTVCVMNDAPDCPPYEGCVTTGYCTAGASEGICVVDAPSCDSLGGKCFALTSAGVQCPAGWTLYAATYGAYPLCGDGAGCCVPASTDPTCTTDADCADYIDPARSSTSPITYVCQNGLCVYQPDCVCPDYYSPVCGYDGVTYDNDCYAKCADTGVAYYGSCKNECQARDAATGNCLCGGFVGYACPSDQLCVYSGDCDPTTGADCLGLCQCPVGMPYCDPATQDYACTTTPSGCQSCTCVPKEQACSSDADCPVGSYCDPCTVPPDCPYCEMCGPAKCVPKAQACTSDNECYQYFGSDYVCRNGSCVYEPGCNCPKLYAPVCGYDGVTYDNECFAKCANVGVSYEGACKDECQQRDASGNCLCGGYAGLNCPSDQFCQYEQGCDASTGPVCLGTCRCLIGMPYCDPAKEDYACSTSPSGCSTCTCVPKNPGCKMDSECAAGEVCLNGLCQIQTSCPAIFDPVCGINGLTYINECEATKNQMTVAYKGQCISCENGAPCPAGYFCVPFSSRPVTVCMPQVYNLK